jgi:hypothetical protein
MPPRRQRPAGRGRRAPHQGRHAETIEKCSVTRAAKQANVPHKLPAEGASRKRAVQGGRCRLYETLGPRPASFMRLLASCRTESARPIGCAP